MGGRRSFGAHPFGLLLLVLFVAACSARDKADVQTSQWYLGPVEPGLRNEEVIAAVLATETLDGGFTYFRWGVVPNLRATYYTLAALRGLGGIPESSADAAVTWAMGFRDGNGWFQPDGVLEPMEVAILMYRLANLLDAPELVSGIDLESLTNATTIFLGSGGIGSEVSRMSWARDIIVDAAGPDHPALAQLTRAIEDRLPLLDASDLRDSAPLAQASPSLSLPPSLRDEVALVLRTDVLKASRLPGPWTEHLLGLYMLDAVDSAVIAQLFSLLGATGAPSYWGWTNAVEAYLLAQTPTPSVPPEWDVTPPWRDRLRVALMYREVQSGGFSWAFPESATPRSTAQAVITLYFAGGLAEINDRREQLGSWLCGAEPSGVGDPAIFAGLVTAAIQLADLKCAPPDAGDGGSRDIDRWMRAYATGQWLKSVSCPPDQQTMGTNRLLALFAVLALEPDGRPDFIADCASALLDGEEPASVLELYALVVLKLEAGQEVDTAATLESLERFKVGYGYDAGEGTPSLAETCSALIIKQMVDAQEVVPILCVG